MRPLRAHGAKQGKRKKNDEQSSPKTQEKTHAADTPKIIQKMPFWEPKWLPKSIPGPFVSLLAPGFAQDRPQDASKSALGSLRGAKKKHWTRPRAPQANFPTICCPSQNRTPTPAWGARRVLPLHFGSLFLKIAAGASAGCKNPGVQGFRGHSWGWGEKLKLLQQQASLLFKASLREA